MATIQIDTIGRFKYTKDDMGQYHSYDDDPAIEYLDGTIKIWYRNGLIHRDDKPAIIRNNYDGRMIEEFYYNGIKPEKINLDIKIDLIDKILLKYKLPDIFKNELLKGIICIVKDNTVIFNVKIIKDSNGYYELNTNNNDKIIVNIDDVFIMNDTLIRFDKLNDYINIKYIKNKTNCYLLFGINKIYQYNNNLNIIENDITYNIYTLNIDYIKWKFTIPNILVTTFNIENTSLNPSLNLNIKDNVSSFEELNNYLQLCFSEYSYINHKKIIDKFGIYMATGGREA